MRPYRPLITPYKQPLGAMPCSALWAFGPMCVGNAGEVVPLANTLARARSPEGLCGIITIAFIAAFFTVPLVGTLLVQDGGVLSGSVHVVVATSVVSPLRWTPVDLAVFLVASFVYVLVMLIGWSAFDALAVCFSTTGTVVCCVCNTLNCYTCADEDVYPDMRDPYGTAEV